jgi:hypothetical protein
MNPNSSEIGPQFELPKAPEGREKQRERAMEAQPATEADQAKKTPKAAQMAQPPVSAAAPIAIPVQDVKTPSKSQSTSTSGMSASDADLIEKQWVNRAKAIVAQTQDDPYKQKKEMGKVKADYIKKRFNKTIPGDDAVSA